MPEMKRLAEKIVAERLPSTKYETNELNEAATQTLPIAHSAMFHGPFGAAVRALEPSTEAHPVAILVHLLAYAGAMVGGDPHVMVGGSRHSTRIWPLVMGATSKGRKGESRAQALRFVSSFGSFSSYFVDNCMASGLSSGEGLLAAFSDQGDGTPADRRLVVTEAEFARVLSVGKRDGNTLPAILRDLWDGGHARTLTKGSPLRVDNVHLVVVGHISPRELRLKLSEADVSGGTLNRFLPVLVERTKLLPEPPTPPNLAKLAQDLGGALRIAERAPARAYARTLGARRYWAKVYGALDKVDTGGALSEIVARAPAYVQRIALLYAIADKATEIDVCHLRAALALVKYSIDSCRIVFGGTGGTGDLGKLSTALQKAQHQQLTMTEVSAVFSRNKPAAALEVIVEELVNAGHAKRIDVQPGKGPPVQSIHWIGKPAPIDLLAAVLETRKDSRFIPRPRVPIGNVPPDAPNFIQAKSTQGKERVNSR